MTLESLRNTAETIITWIEEIQFAQKQCARGGYRKVREIFHRSDTLFKRAAKTLWNTVLADRAMNATPPRMVVTALYGGSFTETIKQALLDEIKYELPDEDFVVPRLDLLRAISLKLNEIVENPGEPVIVYNFMFEATATVSEDGKYCCLEIVPVCIR